MNTIKVTYPGPFDQVEVAACGVLANRGESVEIPEPLAHSLIEQGWKPPRGYKSPTGTDTRRVSDSDSGTADDTTGKATQ